MDEPLIGILTQPVSLAKQAAFNSTQYILDANRVFVKLGGSRQVVIPYNITDSELYPLLDRLNGVLFTGGGLTLIDFETGLAS